MKNTFLLLICLLWATATRAQTNFDIAHEQHLTLLGNAKDSLYTQILAQYNTYIQAYPANAKAQLERCRFIQNAYYDSYEDYNPNEEEAQGCAKELIKKFPGNPEVLLYPTDFLYGDTLEIYLIHLEELAANDSSNWKSFEWNIYQQLANNYSYGEKNNERVILYGKRAMATNDTLDLSIVVAESYQEMNNNELAIEVLLQHLDSANGAWELNRKAQLLLKLGQTDKALEAFRMSAKKNTDIENSGGLAKAMIENGLIAEAREYLLKDLKGGQWNKEVKLHELLKYDIAYGPADSARFTYRRFTEANFFNDPIGWYRIKLIVKDPLMGWTFGDAGRVLLFLVMLAIAFIVPYLWILPIHFIGTYLKQKEKITDEATFRWRLKHFWLACTLWLISSALTTIFFNYPGFISYFNANLGEDFPMISKRHASFDIFFTVACLAFTMALMKWEEIKSFFPKLRSNLRTIGTGIGLAFALRFGLGIYYTILKPFGIDLQDSATGFASVTDAVISINTFYHPLLGLLLLAIVVPIYEEVLFRGVFLSACQRNMKFMVANILQAVVFASLHEDWRMLPFFIGFALVAGYYTRKTGSLITGVSMHMTNNLIAFIGILVMK